MIAERNSEDRPGLLVTFEGPEGSGKTTLIRALEQILTDRGLPVLVLREPGGTEIGERIREILLDVESRQMSAQTELLLMLASRAQLVRQRIRPALAAGQLVLCDRFADASVAYQGAGRQIGIEKVQELSRFVLGDLEPDLTFLCLLSPEQGRARLQGRTTDRLDRESMAFHARVHAAYRAMGASGETRFRVLDASASPAAVCAEALSALKGLEHGLLKRL